MTFEDLHEYPGYTYYPVPNESLEVWQELLQGIPLYKVAGICSGGEVGLFTLLPFVRRQLVLVDHSYRSLYFAMVKYLALQKYGAEETYRRIVNATPSDLKALAEEFDELIPAAVHASWQASRYYGTTSYGARVATSSDVFERRGVDVQNLWARLSQEPLIKTCAKLNKVTFVHGDLTDLAAKGKFGLLYLSNALEHQNRLKRRVNIEALTALVKPGGYILTTSQYMSNRQHTPWEIVNEKLVQSSQRGELNWSYRLHRTPVAA